MRGNIRKEKMRKEKKGNKAKGETKTMMESEGICAMRDEEEGEREGKGKIIEMMG